LRVLDYIATILFEYILNCGSSTVVVLTCFVMRDCVYAWVVCMRGLCVCVGFVMCVSFCNTCTSYLLCFVLFVLCFFNCYVYVYVLFIVLSVLPLSDNSIKLIIVIISITGIRSRAIQLYRLSFSRPLICVAEII
jgi:hypothetical protein